MLLCFSLLLALLPLGAAAADPEGDQIWQISKSKTATQLDENLESQVTLSLPSAEEPLATDIVFVLDKSTSADLENQALEMLKNLKTRADETGATVKVGVVIFNKQANVTAFQDLATEYDAIEAAITQEISSGTNTHAGLLAGQKLLEEDTAVEDSRKYLVFVSDGITYQFGEVPTAVAWSFSADQTLCFAGPDNWSSKYGTNDPPENWKAYMTAVGAELEAQGETYDYPYGAEPNLRTELEQAGQYANSVDKALYLTAQVYGQLQAKYHCYAVSANGSAGQSYPWGPSFMSALAEGRDVSFGDIQNDILYLLGPGSTVTDYMGKGQDAEGNDYDFDFVNDPAKLSVTLGQGDSAQTYPAEKIDDNHYGFLKTDTGYAYELRYSPDGEEGEQLTWLLSVPVSNLNPVSLHYSVRLTNPQTAFGTYGQYDANGSQGYDGLYTNTRAILHPVASELTEGSPEEFARPTVSYTVNKATLRFVSNGGTSYDPEDYHLGDKADFSAKQPHRDGYIFQGWYADADFTGDPITKITMDADKTVYAGWEKEAPKQVTLTYESGGGTKFAPEQYSVGTTATLDKTPVKSGFTFRGWYASKDLSGDPITKINMDTDHTVYAKWEADTTPDLDKGDHTAYIIGYPDSTVRPQQPITRAEVATIFFRLLTEDSRNEHWASTNHYSDVADTDWYNNAISTLTNMGVLKGDGQGHFFPNAPITRAEFAAIAARFSTQTAADTTAFSDVPASFWGAKEIAKAEKLGWIKGYPDGTFRPENNITRAEAMTLVNRVLERAVDAGGLHRDMVIWSDNPDTGAWPYYDVQEATNSHGYMRTEETASGQSFQLEKWTEMHANRNWAQLEKQWKAAHEAA